MKQQPLTMAQDQGFERYRKPTRRDLFLETMNRIVPWEALCSVVEPHYPKAGNGRPPIGLERMLRIHFLQHWFNLADQACEEPQQVEDSGAGRACVCGGQAAVGFYQGPLSGAGQECLPRLYRAGAGEYLPGAPSIGGAGAPIVGARRVARPKSGPEGPTKTG
jgi:hypothetical protein